ncbi:uncharacterized protein LY89DRAFT_737278 [Mollisia scopiformis]|uniref:Uncharacterized protein n=1 Tax=Mollisia scopiformis TaxID=149040 RepID=A0A194X019_MOLSC|nr:uncharacterized protein LY89DRAFT_737278 [Mollisia scopiformis]KUJ13299.1 hypothetical protein LY89DRAFT_737278 [Mollisia scopiformis]
MVNITTLARGSLGGNGTSTTVFNPGEIVVENWYGVADYVDVFEDAYQVYTPQIMASIPTGFEERSLFIMYNFTGTVGQQMELVDSVVGAGVGGLFVTDQAGYTSWSGIWGEFVGDMDGA